MFSLVSLLDGKSKLKGYQKLCYSVFCVVSAQSINLLSSLPAAAVCIGVSAENFGGR